MKNIVLVLDFANTGGSRADAWGCDAGRRGLLALLLAFTCFAQKRPITHEDIWLMKRTGEPVVSPDGRSVVVSVIEPDYDAAKQSSDLWLVAADGREAPRRLTFTRAAESGAVWSPDGTRLAFVTRREG